MIVVLALLFVAILVGWIITSVVLMSKLDAARDETIVANRRNYELQQRLPDDTATCLCDHGINFHAEGNGGCEKVLRNYEEYISWAPFVKRQATCECKRYVGPEPLPTYYHPLEINA